MAIEFAETGIGQRIEGEAVSWPQLLLIGHRGASEVQPENTLRAFYEAIESGANMVELDVWRTKDGKLAISHEGKIQGRKITKMTLEEAQRLKPDLCSLNELAELFEKEYQRQGIWAGIYVEIKDPNLKTIDLVLDTLREYNFENRAIVGSFSKRTVKKLGEMRKGKETNVKVSWLLWGLSPPRRIVEEGKRLGIDFIHPWHPSFPPMSPSLVNKAHGRGIKIISGHTENPKQIEKLRKLGVDGICSNRPDLLHHLT